MVASARSPIRRSPRHDCGADPMRYEGAIFRPPSEARSFILQATIGCSWNACTYCDMYREKKFRVRPLAETLAMLDEASAHPDARFVEKVFVADGDALVMPSDHGPGLDDDEAGTPACPEPGEPDPEDPIRLPEPWTLAGSLEHGELVTEGEVLHGQR